MWSETVSLRTRPVSDQKLVLVLVLYTAVLVCLAGLVLCCETRSCHARRRNDLEGHRNFLSTICSFCILCLEHHYCRDQHSLHLKAFTYLKVKSAKCLCLLPVVLILVLRICSCLHHWIAKSSARLALSEPGFKCSWYPHELLVVAGRTSGQTCCRAPVKCYLC